ncbi:hypothetical protein HN415_07160, partial [Candidatus Woesearchaeota archaeon]|nr:hypothetical protein [Candidatus Woesearchaeota archaeon]
KEQNRYYDNFVISKERIGCIGYEPPIIDTEPVKCTKADEDSDGIISNDELKTIINNWLIGSESINDFLNILDKWKNEC